MTDVNLYLAGEGEGRQSPRDAALDRALERLNIDWKGQFSTAYGPIQAYYFFWDRIGDVDYLNLEIVFSKNPKVCYKSLKRTIRTRDKNFRNNDLIRLGLECVSDIFETVKKEGKIMRNPPSYTQKEEAIAYYDPSKHDEVVPLFHRREKSPPQAPSVEDTLAERGKRYGEFKEHAKISQSLKRAMWATTRWVDLPDDTKEALEMIQHKIARVLNGDPEYDDTYRDVAGYATLVLDRVLKDKKGPQP